MLLTSDSSESRPRREHLIEVALLAGEIAAELAKLFFVACDRFGKAACFVERGPKWIG